MTSPKDEGNFVGLQADNLIDGNIIGSPSTQDSTEERVSNAKLSLNKELPASQVIETINMKRPKNSPEDALIKAKREHGLRTALH
ncbi:hypothetical protein ACE6H2_010343 [Prunus campanulata]